MLEFVEFSGWDRTACLQEMQRISAGGGVRCGTLLMGDKNLPGDDAPSPAGSPRTPSEQYCRAVESGVRTDDHFDLGQVRRIRDACRPFIRRP